MSSPSPPGQEILYDVFISYRHQEPDKSWVRKTLYPRLDQNGVKVCIDFKHFKLGSAVVTEMERAVVRSRYTLAILSPTYLEGDFAEFENVIAQHLGLELSQQRLLLILRQPCSPSLRLRYKLWLEMTSDEEVEENLPRLVETLRSDPSA